MSRFIKGWYLFWGVLILTVGCAGLMLGDRDTSYRGNRAEDVVANTEQDIWWESTLLLRKSDGRSWCSSVVINNMGEYNGSPVSYIVTAAHCNKTDVTWACEIAYDPNGYVVEDKRHKILKRWNHPRKDFTLMMIEGHARTFTPVYAGFPPKDRQDFIIGYRGSGWGDKHQLGKYISPSFAYKGQSGGGVFAQGYGLHAIVSTHTDGVNVFHALEDLASEWMIQEFILDDN